MNLYIRQFHNRLGNNIRQLLYSIHIALFYNYNIILPYHKYFSKKYIIINEKVRITDKKVLDRWDFFHKHRIIGINQDLFKMNMDKSIEILRKCFSIKNIQSMDKNDLVIHIRGGDIFVNPHYKYVMPPLSYYIKIIESNKFEKIIIISQDRRNPCVSTLLKLYPNIEFKLRSLDEDINIILSATNLVESYGTFTSYLLLFSKNIKNIYKPSYQFNTEKYFNKNQVKFIVSDLKKYHNMMGGSWKNNIYQRKLMLNYEMNLTLIKNMNRNKNKIIDDKNNDKKEKDRQKRIQIKKTIVI